jgi:hypothetical protein
LKKKTKFNSMVLSLGRAFDAHVDPLILQPKKAIRQSKQKKKIEEEVGFDFDNSTNSDDNQGGAFVSWCSDDVH